MYLDQRHDIDLNVLLIQYHSQRVDAYVQQIQCKHSNDAEMKNRKVHMNR